MTTSQPNECVTVEVVPVEQVRRGDRIWAHADNDWLLVDRLEQRSDWADVRLYRADHSVAEFDMGAKVLRRVNASGGDPA